MTTTQTSPLRDPNQIDVRSGGGFTVTGPDAMKLLKAAHLKGYIKMYLKSGMIPTRGFGITRMLASATEITQKKYTRPKAEQAIADLQVWIETMSAAIPRTVDGVKV